MDFTVDTLADGRGSRTVNIVDDYTRECVAIEIDRFLPRLRVTQVLDPLHADRGSAASTLVYNRTGTMPDDKSTHEARARALRHLRQLIEALDRRVPHIERSGETTIARDAATLRAKALERIAQLEASKQS
jgi:hypothetical protein